MQKPFHVYEPRLWLSRLKYMSRLTVHSWFKHVSSEDIIACVYCLNNTPHVALIAHVSILILRDLTNGPSTVLERDIPSQLH